MIGDLHCHTCLSDGSSSLEDLVFYGKRGGMDFIALTDHDTMAGATRAVMLGKRYGIGVIPGVELSTMDHQRGKKAHILCYLPQRPQRLEGLCSRTLKNRAAATEEMARLVMRYYPVTMEHFTRYSSGSQSFYKVHIMLALMDLGYTDRVYSDLFRDLFGKNGRCRVSIDYPDTREAVEIARSAGCVVVMAHPFQYGGCYELLEELAEQKLLDGVELRHPKGGREDEARIAEMARHYGLLCTGGTDFHGARTSTPNPIGTCITDGDTISAIFALSKQRQGL